MNLQIKSEAPSGYYPTNHLLWLDVEGRQHLIQKWEGRKSKQNPVWVSLQTIQPDKENEPKTTAE